MDRADLEKKNPDHWTPEKFLQDFIKKPEKIQNYNWTTRDQNFVNYESNSTVFADFSKGILPDGWVRTGLAFQFTENNKLRFDSKRPFIETNSIDSSLYGKKQVGTLLAHLHHRSKHSHATKCGKQHGALGDRKLWMAEHSTCSSKAPSTKTTAGKPIAWLALNGFNSIQLHQEICGQACLP